MDPDVTLAELRGELYSPSFDIDRARELFDALDQWLSNGGFLPQDWKA